MVLSRIFIYCALIFRGISCYPIMYFWLLVDAVDLLLQRLNFRIYLIQKTVTFLDLELYRSYFRFRRSLTPKVLEIYKNFLLETITSPAMARIFSTNFNRVAMNLDVPYHGIVDIWREWLSGIGWILF